MVTVHLDAMLRSYVATTRLSSPATTVGGLLDDLEERYPKLRHRIRNEVHAVRPFVKIFVNGTAVDAATAPRKRIRATDVVDILHSIQGG